LDARFKLLERSKEGQSERAWVSASTLPELSKALEALRGRNQTVKLVVGNTSAGYYKDVRSTAVFVDVSQIPQLLAVRLDARGLELGAATRIAELIDYLEEFPGSPVAEPLVDHLKKLAGGHVRNWGGLVNLHRVLPLRGP
jgi:CO/xanthine dehydrogenase FAD-binding subunit